MRRLCARLLVATLAFAPGAWGANSETNARAPAAAERGAVHHFSNPIVAAKGAGGSADPSVVYRNGSYYYCRSVNDGAIGVARASRLQDIGSAPMRIVWTAPANEAYSHEVWAPELQFINGAWYIYFAASDGDNANHRMYVLQSQSMDPQSTYDFRGKIAPPTSDEWAIDGLAMEQAGALYFVWSGWRNGGDGFPQVTYIARMRDPLKISGDRHEISAPAFAWEKQTAAVMEGHSVLHRNGRTFLIYSTSASWSDEYKLGMLTFSGGDILDAGSWKKSPVPVFSKTVNGGAFGPGHNSFVKSPDGNEDWIVYHAIDRSGGGWAARSVRAQSFHWHLDGTPDFGVPVAPGVAIAEPSGTWEPASAELVLER